MPLKIVDKSPIPKGTPLTAMALMPKVMYVLEGDRYKVYRGNTCVRVFRQIDNAIKKFNKLNNRERKKADRILKIIGNPLLSESKKINLSETHVGFDNVI